MKDIYIFRMNDFREWDEYLEGNIEEGCKKSKRKNRKSVKESANGYTTYRLIDYYDVWGNAEDGWDVNDVTEVADDINI